MMWKHNTERSHAIAKKTCSLVPKRVFELKEEISIFSSDSHSYDDANFEMKN
jgi:hypothetical protein